MAAASVRSRAALCGGCDPTPGRRDAAMLRPVTPGLLSVPTKSERADRVPDGLQVPRTHREKRHVAFGFPTSAHTIETKRNPTSDTAPANGERRRRVRRPGAERGVRVVRRRGRALRHGVPPHHALPILRRRHGASARPLRRLRCARHHPHPGTRPPLASWIPRALRDQCSSPGLINCFPRELWWRDPHGMQEYSVRVDTAAEKAYSIGRFSTGLPPLSKNRKAGSKWSLRKEGPQGRPQTGNMLVLLSY
jgi:hypothetical protein